MSFSRHWATQRYGSGEQLRLSSEIVGSVSWKMSGEDQDWRASFMGALLLKTNSFEEAKAAVEAEAEKKLESALARLRDKKP